MHYFLRYKYGLSLWSKNGEEQIMVKMSEKWKMENQTVRVNVLIIRVVEFIKENEKMVKDPHKIRKQAFRCRLKPKLKLYLTGCSGNFSL